MNEKILKMRFFICNLGIGFYLFLDMEVIKLSVLKLQGKGMGFRVLHFFFEGSLIFLYISSDTLMSNIRNTFLTVLGGLREHFL